jgi:hypothetical protein
MKLKLDRNSPFGEIVAEARRLNRDIKNLGLSKISRNAAITQLTALEAETGLDLRR